MNEFRIVFLGICAVAQLTIGGVDARRIILPNLSGTQVVAGHSIPKHRAFVMFPAAAYVGSDGGWIKPPEVVHNGIRLGFYFLDGDEITLSHADEPLNAAIHHQNAFRLTKVCPDFGAMSASYLTGNDAAVKKAHFDATYGRLRIVRKFAGMRATELTMRSNQANLVLTATQYATGRSRSVTIAPGAEVWIGNMTDAFFSSKVSASPHPHFLAYYLMSANANNCTWVPSEPNASGRRRGKDLGVTCSNSAYP